MNVRNTNGRIVQLFQDLVYVRHLEDHKYLTSEFCLPCCSRVTVFILLLHHWLQDGLMVLRDVSVQCSDLLVGFLKDLC